MYGSWLGLSAPGPCLLMIESMHACTRPAGGLGIGRQHFQRHTLKLTSSRGTAEAHPSVTQCEGEVNVQLHLLRRCGHAAVPAAMRRHSAFAPPTLHRPIWSLLSLQIAQATSWRCRCWHTTASLLRIFGAASAHWCWTVTESCGGATLYCQARLRWVERTSAANADNTGRQAGRQGCVALGMRHT